MTMMRPLDTFMPLVTPFAKGVAIPTAYAGLRQAAIEFCERTKLWRWRDEFDVTPSECDELLAPFGAVVHDIESVHFNCRKLVPKTLRWLDERYREWETQPACSSPGYYTQRDVGTIVIAPRASGSVRLAVWLKPSQEARELPSFLADSYRREIADGALAQILMAPGQPFSNPDMATYYSMKFQKRLDELSTKSSAGQQRARVRSKSSFF